VKPDDRTATAYHEAGHAAVALLLGRVVHRVSIEPKLMWAGMCEFRKGQARPSDDWLENEILIALAGPVAESFVTGRFDEAGAARDLRVARKLMLARTSERSLPRYERRMLGKTESLLRDEPIWKAVELLAAELLKQGTISGRAVVHFYEAGQRE
jgi:ATP-dependent Zn protease